MAAALAERPARSHKWSGCHEKRKLSRESDLEEAKVSFVVGL